MSAELRGKRPHLADQQQLAAALVHEKGDGLEKDPVKAYAWYYCSMVNAKAKESADKSGMEASIEADDRKSLDTLIPLLTPDQLRKGKSLADDYVRRYGTAQP